MKGKDFFYENRHKLFSSKSPPLGNESFAALLGQSRRQGERAFGGNVLKPRVRAKGTIGSSVKVVVEGFTPRREIYRNAVEVHAVLKHPCAAALSQYRGHQTRGGGKARASQKHIGIAPGRQHFGGQHRCVGKVGAVVKHSVVACGGQRCGWQLRRGDKADTFAKHPSVAADSQTGGGQLRRSG